MPARSQAQRGYLAAHFGVDWMRKHHFDNKGKLPKHAPKRKGKSASRDQMIRNFQAKHTKRHG
jgi:hypothetical protein